MNHSGKNQTNNQHCYFVLNKILTQPDSTGFFALIRSLNIDNLPLRMKVIHILTARTRLKV